MDNLRNFFDARPSVYPAASSNVINTTSSGNENGREKESLVDAMPKGGKITIAVAADGLSNSPEIMITFTDTGEGISEDKLEKIWEPFFTTKPEGKGTGLGMAICRRIVEEHDGKITVESELGHGTTVRIIFPAGSPGVTSPGGRE